ncbi:Hypothetical predicted protein [Paramuricea clavata]|uniref:Reverse transcriptase Ty1/copia-type domain-containing protein n=1 Tax=Paramuricea clavata TaxID=317549 RepID=A0A7D9KZC9_PARCT|nr:Hypothetical predicted protein [Paramuricea clavata]
MISEYSSLLENDTWELVPPCDDQNVVGSRWVLKVKRKEDGSIDRFKARVVAQGYSQTKGADYDEVFSSVARHTTLRTLLALANEYDLEVHQMDVRTAFLNGDIDCDIYMEQPEGFVDPDKPDYLCKLQKSIYGLKQSARCWNDTLDGYLKSRGYRKSGADGCIYVKSVKKDGGRISFVILGVYMDDIIPVSNDIQMLNSEKKALSERFKMDDRGEVHYLLGMLIKRDRKARVTTISQRNYVERVLSKFGMESCKPVSTPLEPGTKFSKLSNEDEKFDTQTYQQAIGCLTYLSVISRPDISAAVGALSQFMARPSKDHWIGVKRVLRYLKGTLDYGLKYSADENPTLVGYSDSDWAGDINTRRSTSGYVSRIYCLKFSRARSDMVTKTVTVYDVGFKIRKPITIFEDNQELQ